jgi:two-component system chemotaxis response regulator CheB
MANRDVIVIGASAGGVEALRTLVGGIPAGVPAAILVVVHVPATATSRLPAILQRSGKLPAVHANHGDELVRGRILVARPDHHLVVHGDRVRVSQGARVNSHRPAIDPLFVSASEWAGARAIGVVLSGVLDDGTNGVRAIHARGGVTIAQDPEEALYAAMPESAIDSGAVDHVVAVANIGALLMRLTREEVTAGPEAKAMGKTEDELAPGPQDAADVQGPASGFTCPDCHGALWELNRADTFAYRCRIGHSYAPDSLLAAQSEKIEETVWAGYRAIVESAALAMRLSDLARSRGLHSMADRYKARYDEALKRANTVRAALERGQPAAERTSDD